LEKVVTMSHPSKLKGNRLERLVVKMSEEAGLSAKRAYASDGRSLGEAEDVDVLIDGKWKVQCKARKKIASYVTPPESCDFTVIKEDRGEVLAVLPLSKLLTNIWYE